MRRQFPSDIRASAKSCSLLVEGKKGGGWEREDSFGSSLTKEADAYDHAQDKAQGDDVELRLCWVPNDLVDETVGI